MGTPHIGAEKGDFAKTVLMAGDPLRAKFIAETFLSDVKLVNTVRNALGYTGYYKGKRVSVMASGMGMPSIGIYCYELYNFFDVETIIRIGTCGSYKENINLFDVLICSGACTNSNWIKQYGIDGVYSAISDFELTKKAYDTAHKLGIPTHVGNILSSDNFYNDTTWKKWADMGVMGVEMEAYALYSTAASLNKKALCLLSVTDHFLKEGKATAEERQLNLKKMIEIALEIAE
ncbi:MAG: purine-nucleoside phosphorylase [Erysipelotrichales bacterium]|nr:purine-nucleoside phosphorylase [Erysipelotrichales bacterium]